MKMNDLLLILMLAGTITLIAILLSFQGTRKILIQILFGKV
ncbi:MAG: hypothetical protein ACTSWN_11420 [Promethearchaeota archaeon]